MNYINETQKNEGILKRHNFANLHPFMLGHNRLIGFKIERVQISICSWVNLENQILSAASQMRTAPNVMLLICSNVSFIFVSAFMTLRFYRVWILPRPCGLR